jgi:hypothetical protein
MENKSVLCLSCMHEDSRNKGPQEFSKIAYLSKVRSVLEYDAVIWDPHTNKEIDKIESIHKELPYL